MRKTAIEKLTPFVALFLAATLFSLPVAATKINGNACYPSGSYWFCARYDNTSFNSGGCAGLVPAPHINLETYVKRGGGFGSGAIVNWHVGWKIINGKNCLIAYEPSIYQRNRTAGCIKDCYPYKTAQAGDILSKMSFPDAMKRQSDVSQELAKMYIQSGTSPFVTTVATGTAFLIFAAGTATAVLVLMQILLCLTRGTC